MRAAALLVILAGAVGLSAGAARAQDFPPPRPLVAEVVGPVGYPRPDPYEKWQAYGVDRSGRWRPLVTPYPDGLRYVGTGEPYPWWPNHPGVYRPIMANGATFGEARPPAMLMPAAPVVVEKPATGWERMRYAE